MAPLCSPRIGAVVALVLHVRIQIQLSTHISGRSEIHITNRPLLESLKPKR
jgi:hypothetical protein